MTRATVTTTSIGVIVSRLCAMRTKLGIAKGGNAERRRKIRQHFPDDDEDQKREKGLAGKFPVQTRLSIFVKVHR